MGIVNSTWYVYSRDLDTDSWSSEPLYSFETLNLGYFKHIVYKFALQEKFTKKKAIYLYNGSSRNIKVEVIKPTIDTYYQLYIEFKDENLANKWDSTPEDSDALFCKMTKFKNHYVPLNSSKRYVRRWQLVSPLPNTVPGLPKLSLTEYITSSIYRK